jgi:hypothetical protein
LKDVIPVIYESDLDLPLMLEVPTIYPENVTWNLTEEEANVQASIEFIRELEEKLEHEKQVKNKIARQLVPDDL